jgi:hypothetical protein
MFGDMDDVRAHGKEKPLHMDHFEKLPWKYYQELCSASFKLLV